MSIVHRIRVVAGFSLQKVPDLVAGSRNVYTKISANPTLFPAPIPNMPTYLGYITGLESAQPAVISRTKGAAATRNGKARVLITGLEQLARYVQGVADAATPEDADAIVVASGFKAASVGAHPKAPLTLTNGKPVGAVIARAFSFMLAGTRTKKLTFSWEFNTDGKTWISAPATPIATTTFTGFASGTTVAARVAVTVSKQPQGDWSQVVTIIVM